MVRLCALLFAVSCSLDSTHPALRLFDLCHSQQPFVPASHSLVATWRSVPPPSQLEVLAQGTHRITAVLDVFGRPESLLSSVQSVEGLRLGHGLHANHMIALGCVFHVGPESFHLKSKSRIGHTWLKMRFLPGADFDPELVSQETVHNRNMGISTLA